MSSWAQFTTGRLIHAILWFAAAAALVMIAARIPLYKGIPPSNEPSYAYSNYYLIVSCFSAGVVAFGAGIGALVGKTFLVGFVALVAIVLLVILIPFVL